MTGPGERKGTRAERLATLLARNVVKDLAVEHGACIRPVQLRRTEIDTGYAEQVCVPCGHTLASVCPPCAERVKYLRAVQCREGWHLEDEPVIDPDPPTGEQQERIVDRAEAQADRDSAESAASRPGAGRHAIPGQTELTGPRRRPSAARATPRSG